DRLEKRGETRAQTGDRVAEIPANCYLHRAPASHALPLSHKKGRAKARITPPSLLRCAANQIVYTFVYTIYAAPISAATSAAGRLNAGRVLSPAAAPESCPLMPSTVLDVLFAAHAIDVTAPTAAVSDKELVHVFGTQEPVRDQPDDRARALLSLGWLAVELMDP